MLNKKRLIWIFSFLAVLVVTAILDVVTKSFATKVLMHTLFKIAAVIFVLFLLRKYLEKELTVSLNKVFIICSIVLVLDLVVFDSIRFIFCGGISSIFFLPVCLPIGFMVITHHIFKEKGYDREDYKTIYYIGIPLLLLAGYLELLSFVDW